MASLRTGGGFTLIELLIVISVVAILATLSVPFLNRVQTRTRVSQAVDGLIAVHEAARRLARQTDPVASGPAFGVAIVGATGAAPAYAVVLRGSAATDEYWVDDDGAPAPIGSGRRFFARTLPAAVIPYVGRNGGTPTPLNGRLHWFYEPRTARPVAAGLPMPVGTGAVAEFDPNQASNKASIQAGLNQYNQPITIWELLSPYTPAFAGSTICTHLSLRTRQDAALAARDRMRAAVAIYRNGSIAWSDLAGSAP